MKRLALGCWIVAALADAQSLEITLPEGARSGGAFVHYALDGDETGGWAQPPAGASSFRLDTRHAGSSRVRAILYVPGCRLQTLDLPAGESRYAFTCQPLGTVALSGWWVRMDLLRGRTATLEARYIARWARSFLGLRAPLATAIPLGGADLAPDGRFRIAVPDLAADPLAAEGELQIWAKDRTTGAILAQLTPRAPDSMRARMGGVRLAGAYPEEILFAPCTVNWLRLRTADGFAVRSEPLDQCAR